MWVQSLGREDHVEKEMATNSNILAWQIPRTEKPGGPWSIGSQRVGQTLVTECAHTQWLVNLCRHFWS